MEPVDDARIAQLLEFARDREGFANWLIMGPELASILAELQRRRTEAK